MFQVMIARQERHFSTQQVQRWGRTYKSMASAVKALRKSTYNGWVLDMSAKTTIQHGQHKGKPTKGERVVFIKGFKNVGKNTGIAYC